MINSGLGGVVLPMKVKPAEDFLDPELAKSFRKVINSSPIFWEDEKQKRRYNLICTVMDRVDSAVIFLNQHDETPKREEDFICFLVYACMIKDAIYLLHKNIYGKKPSTITMNNFSKVVLTNKGRAFTDDSLPSDDVFFEYLRSMAFAHPFETSKERRANRVFMQEGETQYCPYVIIPHDPSFLGTGSHVGIRVYSNQANNDLINYFFPFDSLKQYVQERYRCLHDLTQWAEDAINDQKAKWLQRTVNRNKSPEAILKEIHDILEERFYPTYEVDEALMYLCCPLSKNDKNEANVAIFRDAILAALPMLCDSIDTLDYEKMDKALSSYKRYPSKMHPLAFYQLEKIYSYLDKRSFFVEPGTNEAFGLSQAEDFANEFAKKWVDIDVANMEYDEIKLLVATACYLEAKDQEANKE